MWEVNTGTSCPERWLMSISGNTEGHVGWGLEQLSLVGDVPAYCRELDWMTFKDPFQTELL